MTKREIQYAILLFLFLLVVSVLPRGSSNLLNGGEPKRYCISDSSGPTFDLTRMPDFVDLVPGSEPYTMPLELRVGVTDQDGVDTVIGSYRNNSETIWTNVTMHLDHSTGSPNDYVAEACTYTVLGGHFLVVWQIQFYANDSFGNWNVSEDKELSVYRPNFETSTICFTNIHVDILIASSVSVGVVLLLWFLIIFFVYQKSRQQEPECV